MSGHNPLLPSWYRVQGRLLWICTCYFLVLGYATAGILSSSDPASQLASSHQWWLAQCTPVRWNSLFQKTGCESCVTRVIYRFQNVFLLCPIPRLHCFLSSHWPSCRFLSFMAFFIPSTRFFFFWSSLCPLLFWYPLQCYFGQSSYCHSLNMAVPCEAVLFDLFYNCFL